MANLERQGTIESPVSGVRLILVGAAVLILLGIVFQLGALGYADVSPDNAWVLSVMGEGLWNILSMLAKSVISEVVLRYWPILLVLTGCAAVLALNPKFADESSRDSSGEERHGR
jgi:hypothetical protein